MADPYHAIVVGGGHNGLVAGSYLARSGARTVVLEARSKVGGAVDTSAPFPDHPEIKVSTYSYVMSLMPAFIVDQLELAKHGYRVTPFGPYYQAFPDGRSIAIYGDDPERTAESVSRFSTKDAETLPVYEAWIHGITEVIGPLLHRVPPNVGSRSLGDVLEQSSAAWSMRKLGTRGVADATRLFTMSLSDLLDRWFECDQMKTIMMVDGLIGQWSGPDEPGTAYVLLHHAIGSVGGSSHTVNWGYPTGGMGAVADAIRDSARSAGCEIRTDARVERILVRGGRAVGVALVSGEELRAPLGPPSASISRVMELGRIISTTYSIMASRRVMLSREDCSGSIPRGTSIVSISGGNEQIGPAELAMFGCVPHVSRDQLREGGQSWSSPISETAGHGRFRPGSRGPRSLTDQTVNP
jgi:phytoene dehydrogenase-like protein